MMVEFVVEFEVEFVVELKGRTWKVRTGVYMTSQWFEIAGFPYGRRAANRILFQHVNYRLRRAATHGDELD